MQQDIFLTFRQPEKVRPTAVLSVLMLKYLLLIAVIYVLHFNVYAEDNHGHDDKFTQEHTHDHGKVVATISYSQDKLNLHLKLPAHNAFGFEHPPANKQEQELVDSTLETLSNPINIVEFAPDCSPISTNSLDSHEHASTEADNHYDIVIEYEFNCPSSEEVLISFSLFRTIPSIETIRVQYISDDHQNIINLDNGNYSFKIH